MTEALHAVMEPELRPLSVVELGIVRASVAFQEGLDAVDVVVSLNEPRLADPLQSAPAVVDDVGEIEDGGGSVEHQLRVLCDSEGAGLEQEAQPPRAAFPEAALASGSAT